MIYSYGARIDHDSNAITVIDEENKTAITTGYVNGEYVEFGGGSSDFSTAEVTIYLDILKYSGSEVWVQAWLSDGELLSGYNFNSGDKYNFLQGNPFELVLYKSTADIQIFTDPTANIATTGDVTAVANENGFLCTITGDCTITIS